MIPRIFCLLLLPIVLLTACGKQESPQAVAVAEPEAAEVEAEQAETAAIPKYSAQAFFETTAYGLAGSDGFAFSPDGSKLLYVAADPVTGNQDLWLQDLPEGAPSRFSTAPDVDHLMAFSPDGSQVVWESHIAGDLVIMRRPTDMSAPAEMILEWNRGGGPSDWSPDGTFILYSSNDGATQGNLWAVPLDGGEARAVIDSEFDDNDGRISPDGTWFAYSAVKYPGTWEAGAVYEAVSRLPWLTALARRAANASPEQVSDEVQRLLDAAPALGPVASLVRSTHERWDGEGYPDRLAGRDIPLGSRAILICDAYNAMTEGRPYRAPMSSEGAIEELRAVDRGWGRHARQKGQARHSRGRQGSRRRPRRAQARRPSRRQGLLHLLGHGRRCAGGCRGGCGKPRGPLNPGRPSRDPRLPRRDAGQPRGG